MTKMAAMLKNAPNLKNSSCPEPLGTIAPETWYVVSGFEVLQSLYKS